MRTFMAFVLIVLFVSHGRAGEEPAANRKALTRILDEMQWMPSLHGAAEEPLNVKGLPKISAKKLAEYTITPGSSRGDATEREYRAANPEKYALAHPLRGAIFAGVDAMDKAKRLPMSFTLTRQVAPVGAQKFALAAALANRGKEVGATIFVLEQELARMNEAGANRDAEKEKRWHANFEVARARLEANVVYLYEFNYMLGMARAEKLPALTLSDVGWRMTPRPDISIPEPKAKKLAKENRKHWQKIQEDYGGTPWAYFAERESHRELGLQWTPRKD